MQELGINSGPVGLVSRREHMLILELDLTVEGSLIDFYSIASQLQGPYCPKAMHEALSANPSLLHFKLLCWTETS